MKSATSRSSAGRNTNAGRPTCRFADPWGFRRTSRRPERIAGLRGDSIESRIVRRGGVLVDIVPHHLVDAGEEGPQEPKETKSAMRVLRRRQSAAFSRYRRAGWCTSIELRTIEAMWFGGFGTRELARAEGVSPAAISDRVARLRFKSPEFWRWARLRRLYRVPPSGAGLELDPNEAGNADQRVVRRGGLSSASDIASDIAPGKPAKGRKLTPKLARIRRR
jgi:hypothetical protein